MANTTTPNLLLSINAGSSSVKISVYTFPSHPDPNPNPTHLASASIDGITSPPAQLTYILGRTTKLKNHELSSDPSSTSHNGSVTDQASAFTYILAHLLHDADFSTLQKKEEITHITHRIVHGGSFTKMQELNPSTMHTLDALSDLAPLHNATGLQIVRKAHERLPHASNWAYFDSMFHAGMPAEVRSYAIDPKVAGEKGLRKYGFHGISYSFIARSVGEFLHLGQSDEGSDSKGPNIIALHLGSGASACAIKEGRSIDTSMGLTPLAGLPGGSRSGDLDPSLIFHYTHDAAKLSHSSTKEMHISTAEEILNKQSGFKALAGTSDFGAVTSKAKEGDPQCKLAFDLFVDRVLGFIGSYYVKLEGKVDALIFAGGIGEKGVEFRAEVVRRLQCLGFSIDDEANKKPADNVVADIGSKSSKHRVLVCQTDEQFEMARGCVVEASKRSSS